MAPMKSYQSVDAYILDFPKPIRNGLKQLRRAIKAGAPRAEEKVSYGMPGYKIGKTRLYIAAFKDHFSLFVPPSSPISRRFAPRLAKYRSGRAAHHFAFGKALPLALVKAVAKAASAELRRKA